MGYLEILRLARSEGCPWDQNTTKLARKHKHLEIFDWAVAHGCDIAP